MRMSSQGTRVILHPYDSLTIFLTMSRIESTLAIYA